VELAGANIGQTFWLAGSERNCSQKLNSSQGGDYDLEIWEPESIAAAVRYHFPSLRNVTDEEYESFWFTYKGDIKKIISEKRNAVSTSIRKGFKSNFKMVRCCACC